MSQHDNPLRKHFRQPAIYLRLPSQGQHYPADVLDMPPNGEIPILPMTALDEIITRTPDALFNGSSTVEVLRSCVPNIRDPWQTPNTDLNALLVAVRVASYGHNMDVPSKCPNCGNDQEYQVDLRLVLDNFRCPDYARPLVLGDLSITFAPMTYQQVNESSRMRFQDDKTMQTVTSLDMPEEEKMRELSNTFRHITEMTIRTLGESISCITAPDIMVTDQNHIQEFLRNCPKNVFEEIKQFLIKLRQGTEIQPLKITCNECQHQYEQQFTLDMSNFFETAS